MPACLGPAIIERHSKKAVALSHAPLTFKPPRQQRSQESLERILDAAESLIRERGFDDMTIAEVVRRSDSSVGSLYARFGNKLAVLRAVQVRYHARVESGIATEFGGEGPPDETLEAAVRRVVGVLCAYLLSEPELYRAFIVGAVADPQVRAQGEKANSKRRDVVARVLMDHREEIKHPEPEMAVRWAYANCMAVLRERITYGERAKLSGSFQDDAMVRELTRTVTNYLMCDGPASAPERSRRRKGQAVARGLSTAETVSGSQPG